jgi:hypothetical protein
MSAYPRRANEKEVARRAAEEMKRREDILCSDKPLRVFTDLVSRQNPAINRCAQRKVVNPGLQCTMSQKFNAVSGNRPPEVLP